MAVQARHLSFTHARLVNLNNIYLQPCQISIIQKSITRINKQSCKCGIVVVKMRINSKAKLYLELMFLCFAMTLTIIHQSEMLLRILQTECLRKMTRPKLSYQDAKVICKTELIQKVFNSCNKDYKVDSNLRIISSVVLYNSSIQRKYFIQLVKR